MFDKYLSGQSNENIPEILKQMSSKKEISLLYELSKSKSYSDPIKTINQTLIHDTDDLLEDIVALGLPSIFKRSGIECSILINLLIEIASYRFGDFLGEKYEDLTEGKKSKKRKEDESWINYIKDFYLKTTSDIVENKIKYSAAICLYYTLPNRNDISLKNIPQLAVSIITLYHILSEYTYYNNLSDFIADTFVESYLGLFILPTYIYSVYTFKL